MGEPIALTTTVVNDETGERRVTVSHWPRETTFEDVLLAQADPAMLDVRGDMLTIRVANGQATYRLGEPDGLRMWRDGYLVSCRISEP